MHTHRVEALNRLVSPSFPKWLVLGGTASESIITIVLLVIIIDFYMYVCYVSVNLLVKIIDFYMYVCCSSVNIGQCRRVLKCQKS